MIRSELATAFDRDIEVSHQIIDYGATVATEVITPLRQAELHDAIDRFYLPNIDMAYGSASVQVPTQLGDMVAYFPKEASRNLNTITALLEDDQLGHRHDTRVVNKSLTHHYYTQPLVVSNPDSDKTVMMPAWVFDNRHKQSKAEKAELLKTGLIHESIHCVQLFRKPSLELQQQPLLEQRPLEHDRSDTRKVRAAMEAEAYPVQRALLRDTDAGKKIELEIKGIAQDESLKGKSMLSLVCYMVEVGHINPDSLPSAEMTTVLDRLGALG